MQSNSEDEDTVTHRIVWHIRIIMIKTDTEQCWLEIYLTMHRTYGAYTNSVADPAFCGRGSVNFDKQGQSPCSMQELPSGGGRYPPHRWKENGNQKMLR